MCNPLLFQNQQPPHTGSCSRARAASGYNQVLSPVLSFLPLVFVLIVTAVKDAYEDWRCHRSDRYENNRNDHVLLPSGEFHLKPWKDIRAGEVICVAADETLPCEMVLLATSDPTGVAYVRTTNLDGESNLKTRYANHLEQDGHSIFVDGQVWRPEMTVIVDPELVHLVRSGEGAEKGRDARDFMLALATCNQVSMQVECESNQV